MINGNCQKVSTQALCMLEYPGAETNAEASLKSLDPERLIKQ